MPNIFRDSSVVIVGAVTTEKVTVWGFVHHIGAYLAYHKPREHLMCTREVEVMLEIQRFRKYSVERADNVLVPVPRLELSSVSYMFARFCLYWYHMFQ